MKSDVLTEWTKWLAEVVFIAMLYTLTGKLGFILAIPPGNVTSVWIPSGIALAAILLRGQRVWPGVWLGSFLVNSWFFAEIHTTPFISFVTASRVTCSVKCHLGRFSPVGLTARQWWRSCKRRAAAR